MFHVESHRLAYDESELNLIPQVEGVTRFHKSRGNSCEIIAVHATDELGDFAAATAAALAPKTKLSWHLTIARDGQLNQLLPFNKWAYHMHGKARLKTPEKTYTGLNKYSIGIMLENAGQVYSKSDDGEHYYYTKTLSNGQELSLTRGEVYFHQYTTFWQGFPDIQRAQLIAVCRALSSNYGCRHITGQQGIGPALDLDRIRAEVL